MISGYVSIGTIYEKIYRDLGVNNELSESDIISWCAEGLLFIGAYGQYDEISECLPLVNGKAKLPCGFYKLVDINYKNQPVYWATNTNAANYQCHNCRIPSQSTSPTYNTFYLNDSYLISNLNDENNETANICIVYLGIPTDDNGYPMIPDDVYYAKALTSYVTKMLDYQDWRKGKVPDKIYQESKSDWEFYVNSARGSANMPSVQQLEGLKNIMVRLMPLHSDYRTGFKNISKQEGLNLNGK